MARCETCGNDYDKAFEIVMAGTSHTFDSFECAIQALAPTCGHCGCRLLGMGSRPMAPSTVVPTVPAKPAYKEYRIAATKNSVPYLNRGHQRRAPWHDPFTTVLTRAACWPPS
jgi:hypothetical protein